ncbi:hypothetical protein BC828DRAFT_386001 [Blastocladiella britannica]|nr:hypothetical protein BC828DRAFT_386001 [Blastocladiella britannica]
MAPSRQSAPHPAPIRFGSAAPAAPAPTLAPVPAPPPPPPRTTAGPDHLHGPPPSPLASDDMTGFVPVKGRKSGRHSHGRTPPVPFAVTSARSSAPASSSYSSPAVPVVAHVPAPVPVSLQVPVSVPAKRPSSFTFFSFIFDRSASFLLLLVGCRSSSWPVVCVSCMRA